jgi:hypothetical protein
MEVAIYSVTQTALDSFRLAKVAGTGVIAVAALVSNQIRPLPTAQTLLALGEYGGALGCDNTTAAFVHNVLNTPTRSGWGIVDNGVSVGSAPQTYTAVGGAGRMFARSIETAIPTRQVGVAFGDSIARPRRLVAQGQRDRRQPLHVQR